MGANEEFGAFKKTALVASPVYIDSQSGHAELVWEFLIGFAEAKSMFRSQIIQVVRALARSANWSERFASRADLQQRASSLHQDLQNAFKMQDGGQQLPAKVEPAPQSTELQPESPVDWPDWAALEAVVLMRSFSGAGDEFIALRRAVKAASVTALNQQSAMQGLVGSF